MDIQHDFILARTLKMWEKAGGNKNWSTVGNSVSATFFKVFFIYIWSEVLGNNHL